MEREESMPYSTTNPEFDAVLKRLGQLHDAKNAGYAVSDDPLANFRIANRFGISTSDSIAVRLSDKINRWLNLMGDKTLDQVGEAAEETMDDMVVYGMLWLVARAEEKDHPKVEPVQTAEPLTTVVATVGSGVDDITVAWTPEQFKHREDYFPLTEEDIMLAPRWPNDD